MRFSYFIAIICCLVGAIQAIEVSNETDFELYGAPYYFKKEATRAGDIKLIKPHETQSFDRPPIDLKTFRKRIFVFSLIKDDLKDTLSSSDYHLLPHMPIRVGKTFYLDLDKGSFKGYNLAQWMVFEPIKRKLKGAQKGLDELTLGVLRRKYHAGAESALWPRSAFVRESTNVPLEEFSYQAHRLPKVTEALERLGIYAERPLVIAVAGSGGGFRAMLSFLGFLEGMQSIGLLDATSYISAVSGSTWTLGPWMSSGWSLEEFKERLLNKINTDLYYVKPNIVNFIKNLSTRIAFKQPITAVNIYGRTLAANLLSDVPGGPFNIYLHNQQQRIQDGSMPFPIYTAVATKLPYQWVEFTPYEMGGDYFGGYIPIWAFGAPFLEGTMQYATPPYGLHFILAICGSAFAARLSRIVKEVEAGIPIAAIRKALQFGTEEFKIGKHRLSAARVYNWTWGMMLLPRAQQEVIKLIDAGIAYNFGLEALYRRKPDIIIIGDFSGGDVAKELKKAETDLKARGFKVPPIDYTDISQKTVSIFKDPQDPSVPVIIYFPHVPNLDHSSFDPQSCLKSWCSTFNFKYSPDQANTLIELSKSSVEAAAPQIIDEIKQRVESHS